MARKNLVANPVQMDAIRKAVAKKKEAKEERKAAKREAKAARKAAKKSKKDKKRKHEPSSPESDSSDEERLACLDLSSTLPLLWGYCHSQFRTPKVKLCQIVRHASCDPSLANGLGAELQQALGTKCNFSESLSHCLMLSMQYLDRMTQTWLSIALG